MRGLQDLKDLKDLRGLQGDELDALVQSLEVDVQALEVRQQEQLDAIAAQEVAKLEWDRAEEGGDGGGAEEGGGGGQTREEMEYQILEFKDEYEESRRRNDYRISGLSSRGIIVDWRWGLL